MNGATELSANGTLEHRGETLMPRHRWPLKHAGSRAMTIKNGGNRLRQA